MPKAKAAATRAIELDPALGEAYASLALIRSLYELGVGGSARRCTRAPSNSTPATPRRITGWASIGSRLRGHFDRGPGGNRGRAAVGSALQHHSRRQGVSSRFLERRYDEAVQGYCELIADDPSFYKGYTSLGRVYAQQGKFLDAIRMLEKGGRWPATFPTFWERWARSTRWAASRTGRAISWASWSKGRRAPGSLLGARYRSPRFGGT